MNYKIWMVATFVMVCGLAAWAVNSSGPKAKKGEVILGSVQVLVSGR